ncbi:unnamed protein product (macronuclear) [Paramecium tetraurelia]|uniref:UBC core domain-containing protein n=2 Tax=Paramecium TaxID=5884 RepID=A0CAK6_PARTE|nr:uncharacterized protein GSPATT00036603001 [Paramecium tetraurelia]CAD8152458.1 unnamed protein product [Paramecium octaurelia]CAK67823.1 unnamed protein product [Paramecium tetraurelia]|eukprot:XP_001435220.1 hypothetical protein (macronuclear) [Paramecium tetraurelia strain d4-2]
MQSYNPAVSHKRKERDIAKLMMSNYHVEQCPQNPYNFKVNINGPSDSLYAGGVYTINVLLPEQYPYKSPSIGFLTKIFHPNIDEASGSVCLDVINQAWSPMYDLMNVFEVFLPQLLNYPNPSDPLNPDAASLLIRDKPRYEKKVKDMVLKYATKHNQEVQNIEIIKESKQDDEDNVSLISLDNVSQLSEHSYGHAEIQSLF